MDSTTFRNLAMAELDSLHRVAMHLTRNPDRAADLVQDTFVRALGAEQSFELRDHGVRPWLLKILYNVFYSKLRQGQRAPIGVEELEHIPAERESQAYAELATLDWEQFDERLKAALLELPEHYRDVIMLWAVEGLKYREIAEVLDVPLGTVMSRLSRARATLAGQLVDLAAENGIKVPGPTTG